jgi:hypothetical protein
MEDYYISYYKHEPFYSVTLCCNGLICGSCYKNRSCDRFECNLCSNQTGIGIQSKNGYTYSRGWIERYTSYHKYYSLLKREFKFLIPFTKTGNFGTWKEVGEVLYDRAKQEYVDFRRKYHEFVDNWYNHMFLFHTLRSAPMMRLNFLRVKTSPRILEFFKLMHDMAFFSNHSRKKILRWSLNGFNYFILDKLSLNMSLQESQGEKSLLCVKKKFLVMLLRIVLAKNPKL